MNRPGRGNQDAERELREYERVQKLMALDAVFVFGSNLAGIHGAGAARTARDRYGARVGVGEGPTGRAYAIPTKDEQIRSLPLSEIAAHVRHFLKYAAEQADEVFAVTKIGCGYAGYREEQVAPLFRYAPPNCELPAGWRREE